MRITLSLCSTLAIAAAGLSSPALAQDQAGTEEPEYHHSDTADIVVTGTLRRNRQDALSAVAVVSGEALTGAIRPSIGDTLAHTPGVSASSFGPTASRPVLRGLQGERVRVLSNGIGSIDVSNTSADHAPAVNPVLAQRVEVLRGPQSLQYGSAAIGGVVNVIDKRIPDRVPDEAVHLTALATYASAAEERSGAGSLEVPLGNGWVGHADGSYLKAGDLRIGGHALTPALRAEALASSLLPPDPLADPEIDFAANAALAGRLPNTAARTWSAGAGLAYINDGGNIGVAYSHLDTLYGIPLRLATLPGQGQEAPRLHMKQDRIDARAELNLDGALIDRVSLRYAYGDYGHSELDPSGAVGTTFLNKGMEGRLDVAQANRGGWKGASGFQFMNRNFDVIGAEAFLPRNDTEQVGLYTLQQYTTGPLLLEAGGRFEHSRLTSKPDAAQPQFFAGSRAFDAWSFALGGAYDFASGWKFGVNLSRVERAPSAEELFANGPHAGTEAFEIGDPGLAKESAWSAEAILRGERDGLTVEASLYRSWFSNFVYDDRSGAVVDGLPVYRVRQADARMWGFEAQASLKFAEHGRWSFYADALADLVQTGILGSGPAPRIPPLRFMGGLKAKSAHFDAGVEVERVTTQTRTAAFETATPGYTMVNAELSWRPSGNDSPLSVVLSANNLFDVEARRHASFLKDYAPLAGRDIRLTVRVEI
ncbi:MAG: TonB-dependent receptor [Sphingomonadaceae bacterium]